MGAMAAGAYLGAGLQELLQPRWKQKEKRIKVLIEEARVLRASEEITNKEFKRIIEMLNTERFQLSKKLEFRMGPNLRAGNVLPIGESMDEEREETI